MKKLHQIPSPIRAMAAVALLVFGGAWATQALAERGDNEWNDPRRQKAPSAEPQERNVEQKPRNVQPNVEQRDRAAPPPVQMDRRAGHERREIYRPAERIAPSEWVDRRQGRYRAPGWELDARFHHDRYYPRRGSVLNTLPPGYSRHKYRSNYFYFYGGTWFRNVGPNFVVTLPPSGVYISGLPPEYTTLGVDSTPYYYANGVYYLQAPDGMGYVVTDPPLGLDSATIQFDAPSAAIVVPSPEPFSAVVESEPLFVYPRNAQTESQTFKDRRECNQWANGQTGYDPAVSIVDEQQRSNYRRAVSACMDGRGYTVR